MIKKKKDTRPLIKEIKFNNSSFLIKQGKDGKKIYHFVDLSIHVFNSKTYQLCKSYKNFLIITNNISHCIYQI